MPAFCSRAAVSMEFWNAQPDCWFLEKMPIKSALWCLESPVLSLSLSLLVARGNRPSNHIHDNRQSRHEIFYLLIDCLFGEVPTREAWVRKLRLGSEIHSWRVRCTEQRNSTMKLDVDGGRCACCVPTACNVVHTASFRSSSFYTGDVRLESFLHSHSTCNLNGKWQWQSHLLAAKLHCTDAYLLQNICILIVSRRAEPSVLYLSAQVCKSIIIYPQPAYSVAVIHEFSSSTHSAGSTGKSALRIVYIADE